MSGQDQEHRQQGFFSGENLLPDKLRARLRNSWAEAFCQELICIDETLLAPPFSDEASRPNSPVNVLMRAEILKSGFG